MRIFVTNFNINHMGNLNKIEYNGKEYVIPCYGASDIIFDEIENKIPEDVKCAIKEIIWNKIDKEEKKWRYPQKAYEIANAYCEENFS
jgi:hypothetical protein